MKKLLMALVMGSLFTLAACGGDEVSKEDTKQDVQENESNSAIKKTDENMGTDEQEEIANNEDAEGTADGISAKDRKDGWYYKDGFGVVRDYGFGYNDEVGIDGSDAPLKPVQFGSVNLYIENMKVADIRPNEDMKSMFNDQDEIRAIVVTMKAENTSDQDVSFYPDQSVLVTDSGEQVDAETFMSGEVGGDFLGKVKKEGQVWYLLKDNTQDIKNVKLVFDAPYATESMDDLGSEKRLDFEILNPEDAKKRDGIE
ncbi:hypothetical protein WKH56_20460 [Priestia sp. SB1]|uniref:hypothetical protein n=1 Tax=Priestia sp. SB1 TaxID=3132359 RepID=UPI00317CA688